MMTKLLLAALLVLGAAIDGARADAMVSGTVFCDQCKDGQRSMFDYPASGIKVTVACANKEGQITTSKEETTNWLGNYAMRFEGKPNLSNSCYAQVSPNQQQQGQGCGVAAGPAQTLRLMFSMFDMEMYGVDSLLSQPAQPMSFCPNPTPPPGTTVTPAPPLFKLPPPSPLPPLPPTTFLDASACPHEMWMNSEYKCYWKVVNPDTKVALVFGLGAARKYGTDLTLLESLQGRGDPYRTLLREATTALLNSYNSIRFPYQTIGVIQHTNRALTGSSTQDILVTALRFKRANSGYGRVSCKFTTCK